MKIFVIGLPKINRNKVAATIAQETEIPYFSAKDDDAYEVLSNKSDPDFLVDDLTSPKDFMLHFDPIEDIVVFLNRTDLAATAKDYEVVALNIMRDYCLYLSLLGLLNKKQWLEYNYRFVGDENSSIKETGKNNSVFIAKTFNKLILHLKDKLCLLRKSANGT